MSYLKSGCDEPLVDVTLGQLLDDATARWPGKEAYVFRKQGVRMTFADVKQEADRLAAGLMSIGVGRGDVVAWVISGRPEWGPLAFAIAKIGAVSLPLIPLYFWSSYDDTVSKVMAKTIVLKTAVIFTCTSSYDLLHNTKEAVIISKTPSTILKTYKAWEPMPPPGDVYRTLRATRTATMRFCWRLLRCETTTLMYVKTFHEFLHDPALNEYDLSFLEQVFHHLTNHSLIKMKVVDRHGQIVPLQHEGEVWVRGYSMFKCYRGDEEKTAEVKTADGWYKTG
uniref:AMP-dependent synthetase/ligase domain-containing protein n=1 Tax=Branchiostoma floridae TaxID=7739 RepID=C3Y581_BRAFL|eukprot:XP_002608604.1 hypothetical protein BRAFLDRAFT_96130 [Branchiostoma floridae]